MEQKITVRKYSGKKQSATRYRLNSDKSFQTNITNCGNDGNEKNPVEKSA
jgi:hypothetical protein